MPATSSTTGDAQQPYSDTWFMVPGTAVRSICGGDLHNGYILMDIYYGTPQMSVEDRLLFSLQHMMTKNKKMFLGFRYWGGRVNDGVLLGLWRARIDCLIGVNDTAVPGKSNVVYARTQASRE